MNKKIFLKIFFVFCAICSYFNSTTFAMTEDEAYYEARRIQMQRQQQIQLIQNEYNYGVQAYIYKDYKQAIYRLGRVEKYYGNQKDFNIMMGDSLRNLNNLSPAINYLNRAYNLGSKDFVTLTGLGYSFMDLNNFQQAYPYLNIATQYFPQNPDIWWNLGVTCKNLKQENCQLGSFIKVLELRPNYNIDSYLFVGDIFYNHKKYDESLKYYVQGLQYFKQPILYYLAGDVLFINEKYEDAISYLSDAIRLQQDYMDAYYELGFSYFYLDDLNNSSNICSSMMKINDKDGRTIKLCQSVQQKIMQKQMEQQMQQDIINQQIEEQNQQALQFGQQTMI